jgi:transcriptional regulator with XRE-family HTH domain
MVNTDNIDELGQAEIVKRIEFIREDQGLNKKAFCETIGIVPNYYSQIVSGDRPVSLKLLLSLDKEFLVDLHWILTGECTNENSKDYPTQKERLKDGFKFLFGKKWEEVWEDKPEHQLSDEERGELFVSYYKHLSDEDRTVCFIELFGLTDKFSDIVLDNLFLNSNFKLRAFKKTNQSLGNLIDNIKIKGETPPIPPAEILHRLASNNEDILEFKRLSNEFMKLLEPDKPCLRRYILEKIGKFSDITMFFSKYESFFKDKETE